ncbi:MAG: alpha/beta fold hydrolase [Gemmatimonadaceae bacterium]|nr:alpha/beta fold hydrolase [Gemmatimonadaceae bacterium]
MPPRRPQEPALPHSYESREIRIADHAGAGQRSGVLTVPRAPGPHAAVLMIPGSGKQDRDESVCGHRPFLVWADTLTRAGFVVLRLDDRGIGGSSGDKDQMTHEDLVVDTAHAVLWLSRQPEVAPGRLAVLGHSEGALRAAAMGASPQIAAVVMLAGPAVPGHALILSQSELLSRAAGADDATIAHERAMNVAVFDTILGGDGSGAVESRVRDHIVASLMTWPSGALSENDARAAATQMSAIVCAPGFVSLLRSNPAELITRVQAPVLALYGERDLQVPAVMNAAPMREALHASERARWHAQSKVEIVSGANHLFQHCTYGTIDEYETIDETVAPAVLERVLRFLHQTMATTSPSSS